MSDDEARKSLNPVIQALQASIPMQKAIENHLQLLEKLRAFGYSNGFISEALSSASGKPITAQLFASMMYRARKKTPAPRSLPAVSARTVQEQQSPGRPRRFVHNPTPPDNIFD
ncbi:hypothetical protein D9M70_411430 [compost metagenome]